MAIGKLHVLVLHFPIALILAAGLADMLWLLTRKAIFKDAGYYCIILGALGAIATVITGSMLIDTLNLTGEYHDLGETHEALGITTMIVAILAGGVRVFFRNRLPKIWAWVYGLLILSALTLVSITGHYGGMIAFGKDYLSNLFNA
jgi:uncharacterized membrane protein